MKKKKLLDSNLIFIVVIILFAIGITPKILQNDTFYTIKIGEIITQNGIDFLDHFSIHNLTYTYPHWLYDIVIYNIYNIFKFRGIYISIILLTIILGLCFFITNCKLSKNKEVSFCITIIVLLLLRPYISARAQMVTFILFILEILVIEKIYSNNLKYQNTVDKKNSDTLNKSKRNVIIQNLKYILLLFVIGVFIANFHSAVWPFFFVIFLPYIAEFIVVKIIEKCKKKSNNFSKENITEIEVKTRINLYKTENFKILIIAFIVCLFSGLLTPIKFTPYTYLIKTLCGNSMSHIQEHLPMVLADNIYALIIFGLFFAIFIFTNTKIRLKDLFMIVGLMILAIFSIRQFSMFVLIGGVSINLLVCEILENRRDLKEICIVFGIFGILVSGVMLYMSMKSSYIDESIYPTEAVKWLKKYVEIEEMKLYNEYDFGSFLIYEDIPVFIDSRADLYTPEFNGEEDILSDFFDTSNMEKYYEDTFKKYDITHIILYNDSILSQYLSRDSNYKILYLDDVVIIYERTTN